jgi:hypothetical protein
MNTETTTETAEAFPLDFYAARSAILHAIEAYPVARNPDVGLSAAQMRKRRGENFMAPERLANRRVGPFMVEVATGTFLQSRMVGLTAFRLGGERDSDTETSACVHTVEEMVAHLAKLAAEG